MKKNILFLVLTICCSSYIYGQTTILDFETPETSAVCNYFGSTNVGTNNIVANPTMDGVNGSATVGDFVKPPASEVWAGAWHSEPFADLDFAGAANQVCVKVLMPHIGNLALKLENSTNDGPNWILSKPNTLINQWEELCFDVVLPSIEAPSMPADEFSYEGLVLFFDFGDVLSETATYYYDDVVVQEGTIATEGAITFSVDMTDYADPFTTVYVSGSFNNWEGTTNPLTDMGNGIWEATVENIAIGAQEYKFTIDDWAVQEEFNGYEICTSPASAAFKNRLLSVAGDASLNTVCWNSCYACGDAVNITVALGTSNITVSGEGVFIAGGGNFGAPGDFPLLDDDGDGVYTATFERPVGFSSFYTFTNGACGDFSCKENIEGQDCANPDSFNDRWLNPVMADTTVATCFAICTTDTDCGGNTTGMVTFKVDMNQYMGDFTTAYIAGSMNGWSGDANPLQDDDGDGIWETTLELAAGAYEYKFPLDNWGVDEMMTDGDPCTITDPSGTFVNRFIEVDGDATVCFVWSSCEECEGPAEGNITFQVDMNDFADPFTTAYIAGSFNGWSGDANPLQDDDGDGIWETTLLLAGGAHEYKFPLDNWGVDEVMTDGDPCTITDPSGQFVNRLIEVDGDETVCFIWQTCDVCVVGTNDLTIDHTLFSLQPNVTSDETTILFKDGNVDTKQISIYNTIGKLMLEINVDATATQQQISTSNFANGIYIISVQIGDTIGTQKLIKQ